MFIFCVCSYYSIQFSTYLNWVFIKLLLTVAMMKSLQKGAEICATLGWNSEEVLEVK